MELVIGENSIFVVPMTDVNDDPLVISTLARLKVQIIQYDRVLGQFVLLPTPDPVQSQIRINASVTTSFDYELTQSLSNRLKKGELFMKIFASMTETDFEVDGEWLDIDIIKLCDVV